MKRTQLKTQYKALIAIIAIGLIARLVTAIYLGNQVESLPGTYDQISYHNLALRLVSGHGFSFGKLWWPITAADAPTAHWSYLYTLYLAGIYKVFGPNPLLARLLQVLVVGILQPLLVFLIGRHIFSEAVGLFAAALTVIYSYFVYYSATLMTEPFYISAILASLYLTIRLADIERLGGQRKLTIGLGLSFGIAVLLRQLFLLFIPFLLLWFAWVRYKRYGRIPYETVLLIGLITSFMILPFTIFNYMRFDQFVLLNTNAGYALFWANNPLYGTRFEPILPSEMGSYQDLIPVELRGLDEAALDRALLRRGIQFILEDPVRYTQLSLSRIQAYFMFWPTAESNIISNVARVSSFGVLWPFMLYGLFYAALQKTSSTLFLSSQFPLILFVVIYSAIHLLSWSLIRYRLPVDAVMLIFAGLAILQLLKKFKIKHLEKLAIQLSES